MKKLAHISDLHFGRKVFNQPLKKLVKSLDDDEIDQVVITGDITDHGYNKEYNLFCETFAPLIDKDKVIIIPGNHDRLGDNIASYLMDERVIVEERKGVYIIRIDSTGPHNKWLIYGHGIVCHRVLTEIEKALLFAPKDKLVVVLLHHHPIPLPEETIFETISKYLKWPFAAELHLGKELINLCKGRADLLLHGHRHIPFELNFPGTRALSIYNAGCTPRLEKYRVFSYKDGVQTKEVKWYHY